MSTEMDNSFRAGGVPPRRFYLERLKDETGVSRTGRVLEGVVTQSGKVFVEWRPPHSTIGIYNTFEEFKIIHVDCHPSCNVVIWLDPASWLCCACGASGETGNFCAMCGSGSRDYIGRDDKHCRKCGTEDVPAYANFCPTCGVAKPLTGEYAFAVQDAQGRAGLNDRDAAEVLTMQNEREA